MLDVVTPGLRGRPDVLPNSLKHLLETVNHFLEAFTFIVSSLRLTCAIMMLSVQHLEIPHRGGGRIGGKNGPFVYTDKSYRSSSS